MKILLLSLLFLCNRSALGGRDYINDYEDNVAMESLTPQSFQRFTNQAQSFNGFLHRTGLFSDQDSDYGAKINKVRSDSEAFRSRRPANVRESSSRKVAGNSNDTSNDLDILPGLNIHPNIVQSFLGGKNVDEVQDELKSLLFGDNLAEFPNSTSVGADSTDPEGDQLSFEDDDEFSDRSLEDMDEESDDNPIAAELRQRPFRQSSKRRRPFRTRLHGQNQGNRLASQSQGRPVVMRPNPPIRDFRDPQIHKIPGRIQKIPDRFPPKNNIPDVFGSFGQTSPSINSVSGSGPVDCDFYTDSLCLGVKQYPIKEISRLLNSNRRLSTDMIADVSEQSADDLIDGVSSNQELTYDYSHYFGQNRRQDDDAHKHRDFAEEGGFLCPSEIKYAKPKRGKTAQGVWKDIVNVDDYTQTLRMEKCLKPGGSCSYVSHHYKSQCSQVYNYHRLLSWDKERGLHMDIYKVPTCCSCHIMGYSYVYPPLKKQDQSPAIHAPPSSSSSSSSSLSQSSVKPGTFVDFGQSSSSPGQFNNQPQRPPPQLTPDTFPSRPTSPGSFNRPPASASDFDNFIPDFDPQEELQAFMNSIGDDFKDFNFDRERQPARNQGRPPRQPKRPLVGGFNPISGNRGNRRGPYQSVRRGDGFGPNGEPSFNDEFLESDPSHKYESIPLDSSEDNFVRKQLNIHTTEDEEDGDGKSVNYAYHPIIDFFAQS